MTKAEVEAARKELSGLVAAAYGNGWNQISKQERDSGYAAIDALCAAAVTDDLVGRRVRLTDGTGRCGAVAGINAPFQIALDGTDPCCSEDCHEADRGEFELLEADDAKP